VVKQPRTAPLQRPDSATGAATSSPNTSCATTSPPTWRLSERATALHSEYQFSYYQSSYASSFGYLSSYQFSYQLLPVLLPLVHLPSGRLVGEHAHCATATSLATSSVATTSSTSV
jgi:hypothetical protein